MKCFCTELFNEHSPDLGEQTGGEKGYEFTRIAQYFGHTDAGPDSSTKHALARGKSQWLGRWWSSAVSRVSGAEAEALSENRPRRAAAPAPADVVHLAVGQT